MTNRKSDQQPAEILDEVRRKIQTEGVRAAVDALISVCTDSKSPAPAKATAGTSLLRAAGLFANVDDGGGKEPHEMSAEELEREIAQLKRRRSTLSGGVLD